MKELTKVRINEFVEMTNNEMRYILGGASCTATCTGGSNVSFTDTQCSGTCSATNDVGVTCTEGNKITIISCTTSGA